MLSEENKGLRRGRITASEVHKIMGARAILSNKTGENLSDWSDTAQTYILEKVSEMVSYKSHEIRSKEMDWGNDHEPDAKKYFTKLFGYDIKNQDFTECRDFPDSVGCTPDAILTQKNSGLEIKCPYTLVNHMKYSMIKTSADLKSEKPEYFWQVMMNIYCTGKDSWYFMSYHPFFNPSFQVFCIEISKDDESIRLLRDRLSLAIKLIKKLTPEPR